MAMETKHLKATVIATQFEIYCPNPRCDGNEAIPTDDGCLSWSQIPKEVTCPDCGQEYAVGAKITRGIGS